MEEPEVTTFSPPETRIIGYIMKQTLSKISDYSLNKCVDGLNSVISELKDELGDSRFSNQLYSMLLTLSIDIDWEYMRRQKESFDKQK